MSKPYDIEQINVMAWLRFPLIMGVVLAHCNLHAILQIGRVVLLIGSIIMVLYKLSGCTDNPLILLLMRI